MKKCLLPTVGMLCMSLISTHVAATSDYASRPEVREFVEELAAAHEEITVGELLSAFEQATYKQNIIDAISRPAEKTLNWDEYQDIFLTRKRVREGKRFIAEYRAELDAARTQYGVPPEIVAAIIGVETMYGSNRGSFKVLDALTTLAFDYPPRSRFFKSELRHFFLLAVEEKQQVTEVVGSYAGAMGYGQFIPSSYRRYAVDFDSDGVRDIWNNPVDAIGSVANYLNEHGWRAGEHIVVPVELADTDIDGIVFNTSLKPSRTAGELLAFGIRSHVDLDPDEEVSPMRLKGKKGDELWLGLRNFYVITRYNHSRLYAMAVYQLSEQLVSDGLSANP